MSAIICAAAAVDQFLVLHPGRRLLPREALAAAAACASLSAVRRRQQGDAAADALLLEGHRWAWQPASLDGQLILQRITARSWATDSVSFQKSGPRAAQSGCATQAWNVNCLAHHFASRGVEKLSNQTPKQQPSARSMKAATALLLLLATLAVAASSEAWRAEPGMMKSQVYIVFTAVQKWSHADFRIAAAFSAVHPVKASGKTSLAQLRKHCKDAEYISTSCNYRAVHADSSRRMSALCALVSPARVAAAPGAHCCNHQGCKQCLFRTRSISFCVQSERAGTSEAADANIQQPSERCGATQTNK